MTDQPGYTVLRWQILERGAVRVLVRIEGGRRVQVYVGAANVTDEGVAAAIDAAITHLPRPVGPHT